MKRITAKVLLLGSQGVGKTSILMRQTNETFNEKVKSTIGASFSQSSLQIGDNVVMLQIWDTAGQERFRSLVTMYYRNATAAFLVYDITDNLSFLQVKSWVEELNRYVGHPVVLCVLGNKCDLEDQRQVDPKHGQEYATSIGALFFETSALSNAGINAAFDALAKKLIELENQRPDLDGGGEETLRTHETLSGSPKKKKCC